MGAGVDEDVEGGGGGEGGGGVGAGVWGRSLGASCLYAGIGLRT